VALTADQDEEKKEICQQEGFNDIITKPISRDQLQRALDRWIL
jgi:CheY-like chemotaxis protein